MAKILIIYSTTDGHTGSICERLQGIAADGNDVDVVPMAEQPGIEIGPYDKVVIGASIRYGKHQQEVFDFIERNKAALESKPNAFFSVIVVARKPEKNPPDTNPDLPKVL